MQFQLGTISFTPGFSQVANAGYHILRAGIASHLAEASVTESSNCISTWD